MFRWTKINPLDARRTHFIGTWCRRFSNSVPTWNQSGVNLFRFKLRNARIPDAVQSPRLTPQMVTSILRMNEETVEENNGPVKSYVKNQLQVSRKLDDQPSVINSHSAWPQPTFSSRFVRTQRTQPDDATVFVTGGSLAKKLFLHNICKVCKLCKLRKLQRAAHVCSGLLILITV